MTQTKGLSLSLLLLLCERIQPFQHRRWERRVMRMKFEFNYLIKGGDANSWTMLHKPCLINIPIRPLKTNRNRHW